MSNLLRSLWIWFLFFTITPLYVFAGLVFLILGKPDRSHDMNLAWSALMVRLSGVKLVIENEEKILREPPVIYMSNHSSILDIIICGSVLKAQYRWLAKDSLFRIPLMGAGMRATGYIPVSRASSKAAQQSLFDAAKIVRGGRSVMIFPEGTTTETGRSLPFKSGGFVLARKAQVPIQPFTIIGAYQALPEQDAFVQRVYGGTVRVIIHDPIMPEDYADDDTDELKARLREIITAPLDE